MFFKDKVVAYDLDGTLLTTKNTVDPFTIKMCKQISEQGGINVIATGRGILSTKPLLDQGIIQYFDYSVCSNGMLIYDIKNNKLIPLAQVKPQAFEVMKKYALKHNLVLTIDTTDFNGVYINVDENKNFPEWVNKVEFKEKYTPKLYKIDELAEHVYKKDQIITQMALRAPYDIAPKIKELVASEITDHEVFLTNSVYIDINAKNVNKFYGLQKLLQILEKSEENLISFGDSGNDIQMIKHAKIGYALGNATDDAKAAADEVIGHHDGPAIGIKIEQLLRKYN